jgi:hypothetical protein
VKVIPIIPEREIEKKRFDEAEDRRKYRLQFTSRKKQKP